MGEPATAELYRRKIMDFAFAEASAQGDMVCEGSFGELPF